MVHIEIIEPESNAGGTGKSTTSSTLGVISTSKTSETAKAEINHDDEDHYGDDSPLVRLAQVIKVSIEAGFVDSSMLLNLEKAYNSTPSVGTPETKAEAEGADDIVAQAAATTAIIGPKNNPAGTSNVAETKLLFGEDMWEALTRRAWPKCGEIFLTEISKMTTYRDLFVKSTTSDGTNGGWFEKICADIGGGRAAVEFYASNMNAFDSILRDDAGEDTADKIEVVLAALSYIKQLEYPQRHDDEDDDEEEELVNKVDDHYSRATITLGALPQLVGLLKCAAVPATVHGSTLDLLASSLWGIL